MPIIFRIGLLFLQLVVFFVMVAISAKAFSYLTAETYRPGDPPRGDFSVIAVRPLDSSSQQTQYHLVRWSTIEET